MLILIFSILLPILASTCTLGPRAPYPYHPHLPYPAQPSIPHAIPSVVVIPETRPSMFIPTSIRESLVPTVTMNTTIVVEEEQSLVVVTTDIVNTTTVTVSITPGAGQSQSSAWWNNCGSFCGNIPNTTSWAYDATTIMNQRYWYMFGVTGAICLLMIVVI